MNYSERDGGFRGDVIVHRVYCGTCCLDRGTHGPFIVHAETRDDAVKRWNRLQYENYCEELQYEKERQAHEDSFNAVYSFDPESRV